MNNRNVPQSDSIQTQQQHIWKVEGEHIATIMDPMALVELADSRTQEDDFFLTPQSSPFSAASPYSNCTGSPTHTSEGYDPSVDYSVIMQTMQTMVVPQTHYPPPSTPPGDHDSGIYSPSSYGSPYNSPNGSPIACSTASQYTHYPCSLAEMNMCDPNVIHPEHTKLMYTSEAASCYYPSVIQTSMAGHPWQQQQQLPSYSDAFGCLDTPLPRTDSRSSLETDVHTIHRIDRNSTIDLYPLTPPSPDSPQCITATDFPSECHFFSPPPTTTPFPMAPSPSALKRARKTPRRPPRPPIHVDDTDIKDIPTSAQLWEFTLRVIKKPKYSYMISWENQKEGLFRFHDAQAFAALWGKHRNRPNMTYDKVARALRYYYKRDILSQVGGRLTYRFSKRLSKLYMISD